MTGISYSDCNVYRQLLKPDMMSPLNDECIMKCVMFLFLSDLLSVFAWFIYTLIPRLESEIYSVCCELVAFIDSFVLTF